MIPEPSVTTVVSVTARDAVYQGGRPIVSTSRSLRLQGSARFTHPELQTENTTFSFAWMSVGNNVGGRAGSGKLHACDG